MAEVLGQIGGRTIQGLDEARDDILKPHGRHTYQKEGGGERDKSTMTKKS